MSVALSTTNNTSGMKIRAVTRIQPPFTYACALDGTCADSKRGGGINYDVFVTLMNVLGIEFDFIAADQGTTGFKDSDGNWHGMMGQLDRGEANMTATLISYKSSRLDVVDYCTPVSYFISGFIIQRPSGQDVRAIPSFLATPFTIDEWMALMASVILSLIMFTLARRVLDAVPVLSAFREQSFLTTRALLQQTEYKSGWHTVRLMVITMEIGLFFLTAQYSSVLTSQLLVKPKLSSSFKGYDQFAQLVYDKKKTVITDDNPKKDKYVPLTTEVDSDDPQKKLQIAYAWNPPVFVPANDYDSIVKAISKNSSLVYYNSYYQLLNVASLSCDVVVVEDTFTHPVWLSFAFPKGSPLQNLISTALHHDATSAQSFVTRLYKKYAKDRRCFHTAQESSYEPMGIIHMQGAFWIVMLGSIIASFAFLFEKLKSNTKAKLSRKEMKIMRVSSTPIKEILKPVSRLEIGSAVTRNRRLCSLPPPKPRIVSS